MFEIVEREIDIRMMMQNPVGDCLKENLLPNGDALLMHFYRVRRLVCRKVLSNNFARVSACRTWFIWAAGQLQYLPARLNHIRNIRQKPFDRPKDAHCTYIPSP